MAETNEPLDMFEEHDISALLAMVDGGGEETGMALGPSVDHGICPGPEAAHAVKAEGIGAADTPREPTAECPLSKTEKARLKSRRFYHRRANLLRSLRDEVAELETTLQRLGTCEQGAVASQALQSLPALLQSLDEMPRVLNAAASPREEREQLLAKLQAIFARLHDENVLLRTLSQQSSRRLQLFRDLTRMDDSKLYMANDASFALIRPLTLDDCVQIRDKAIQEYSAFSKNDRYVTPSGSVCGWRECRVFEDGVVNFALSKTMYHHTVDFIFERTWRVLSDPAGLSRMYSDSLNVRCYVVQTVDDSNVVLYHESHKTSPPGEAASTKQPVVVKSILLLSRFRTTRGYFMLIRGLDSDRFEIREKRSGDATEVWNDLFAWIKSEKVGARNEHCLSSYAGITPTVGADPKFWVGEIILHVLRWEAEVFGPRFSLPKSDE